METANARPFLYRDALEDLGGRRFNYVVERALYHLGFEDVRVIDGANDTGGDILAVRGRELFVLQNKWTSRSAIGRAAVDEVERAKAHYAADRAVVVTNALPDGGALDRQRELASVGVRVDFWHGELLSRIFDEMPDHIPGRVRLRGYQEDALDAIERDLRDHRRALLILATGLGKTVVGAEIIARHLADSPGAQVLVVAHMKELVHQLEKAMWRHLAKGVPTQILTGDYKPARLDGVTCATVESALSAVVEGYRPDLVMVDETHHVAELGQFRALLETLDAAQQFGCTATPWRGDTYDITDWFGQPSFTMSIAEGMARGYLAHTDYRLFVDNVDWDTVRNTSQHGYSLKELNEKLFLPQRDEAVCDSLLQAWNVTPRPRAIVFCRTIEHAEHMADLLSRFSGNWRRAACLHSRVTRRDREVLMSDFRLGRVPLMTVVDIFNEGVDVPDVNIICFLRVTHSRRIFIQQLGRGLRLQEGKERVTVLDFVTDIRRIAAALDLRRALGRIRQEDIELLELPPPSSITFSDEIVGNLMEEWIQDAASLETAADEVRLQFPAFLQTSP